MNKDTATANDNSARANGACPYAYGPHRDRGLLERIAATPLSVLIAGETGTGKEILACKLHRLSGRDKFVAVNCGALSASLIESELFGHKKGAFTGASHNHKGHIEAAHGGTLFLDEITEMPLDLQSRLLRALQEREVTPVGSTQPVAVDIRVLSATQHDPQEAVSAGRLREDLYYRLNEFSFTLPPLRDRPEEIIPLAEFFAGEAARETPGGVSLASGAKELLQSTRWPGNIRQLRSTVCTAFHLSAAPEGSLPREITAEHLMLTPAFSVPARQRDEVAVVTMEDRAIIAALAQRDKPGLDALYDQALRAAIRRALEEADGNAAQAANLMQMDRRSLYRSMGGSIERPAAQPDARPSSRRPPRR